MKRPRTEKQKAVQFGGEDASPMARDLGVQSGPIVRSKYRRVLVLEVNESEFDGDKNVYRLAQKLAGRGIKPTVNDIMIAHRAHKAMNGYDASIDKIEDAVDGKLPENLNVSTVDRSKEKLTPEMSRAYFEEMARINKTILKQLT